MGTALLALCFCALSLVLALFVGISPISDKAKVRFMLVLVKKKKTGVKQEEKLGVTPVTVSKWCSNITQPSLQTLGRIATLLEVDPRELLKGKE